MARALSPAYLRLGGNAADFLFFQDDFQVENVELDSLPYEENYDGWRASRDLSPFNMSGVYYFFGRFISCCNYDNP